MRFFIKQVPTNVWFIIFGITIIKLILAAIMPLSNDEVYYHTYALYPALSHFDHPPMVGWIIQLFTFNMSWHNDFFMRLGAIFFSVINSLIVYQFVVRISSQKAALIGVVLYNASFYNSVVSGFFIMPDTGLMTFWLLSLSLFHRSFAVDIITNKERKWMLLAGLMVGFAMLSKYQAAFLWFSAFLFILKYRKAWLIEKSFYLSGIITIVIFSPVIIWNIENDFISFAFQGERANFFQQGFNYFYFAREFFGQILYTNVAVYILVVWSLIYYKKNVSSRTHSEKFLLFFGLPTIVIFLFISIFKSTLPHWSGPGFSTLILFASIMLANENKSKIIFFKRSIFLSASFYILAVVVILLQLAYNLIPLGYHNDPTSDITGWDQLATKFTEIRKTQLDEKKISKNHVFLSNRWFPAAHYDYYLAEPNHVNLILTSDIADGHKYLWMNKERGGVPKGFDAYYITTEPEARSAEKMYPGRFDSISPPDTISITRNHKLFISYYLYILHGFKGKNLYETIPPE